MIGDTMKESLLNKDTGTTANPERWVDEHGDCLYRYALLAVRNPAVAQDLVQDTLLAALRTRENFAGRSSERTWLCGILKNKIVDHFRKLGRETSFTDMEFLANEFSEKFVDGIWIHHEVPTAWKLDVEVVTHRAEFWAVMKACLDKLPDRIATVFPVERNGRDFHEGDLQIAVHQREQPVGDASSRAYGIAGKPRDQLV